MNASRSVSLALRVLVIVASLEFQTQDVQSQHTPFPVPVDWNKVKIDLSRTGCFGFCPAYRLEIRGDGTVSYDGQFFVAIVGQHSSFANPNDVRTLVNIFRLSDFYSFKDDYTGDPNRDCSTTGLAIEIDGKRKSTTECAGGRVGLPRAFIDLEDRVDQVAKTNRWMKGDADTVPGLRAENWNFKSREAANTLVRIVQYGNADALRGFIAAGVPLNGRDDLRGSYGLGQAAGAGRSALERAVFRNDMGLLQILVQAGAGTQDLSGKVAACAMSNHLPRPSMVPMLKCKLLSHPGASDEKAINGVIHRLSLAFANKSIAEFEDIWPQMDPNAKAILTKSFASSQLVSRDFHVESIMSLLPNGVTAVALGNYDGKFVIGPRDIPSAGNFSVTLKKKDGKWIIDSADF